MPNHFQFSVIRLSVSAYIIVVEQTDRITLTIRASLFSGLEHWTGLLDWNTGLDYWTGTLDWTTGLEHWTGLLDWNTGLDYWTGTLDWTTGLEHWTDIFLVFAHSIVGCI